MKLINKFFGWMMIAIFALVNYVLVYVLICDLKWGYKEDIGFQLTLILGLWIVIYMCRHTVKFFLRGGYEIDTDK